ncbi:receptor-type tyrosine-protein phosphatase delta [Paragonimus westermani]|uniref:protein-tyrosine-phosphatase n=1 Tax=Paragonimus westermani TaxID=34504 RepID=A0A5J4P1Q9_9TREM|nr:receptor-type tyrosine-protein phosphatase delta [Paragonimus westermani]
MYKTVCFVIVFLCCCKHCHTKPISDGDTGIEQGSLVNEASLISSPPRQLKLTVACDSVRPCITAQWLPPIVPRTHPKFDGRLGLENEDNKLMAYRVRYLIVEPLDLLGYEKALPTPSSSPATQMKVDQSFLRMVEKNVTRLQFSTTAGEHLFGVRYEVRVAAVSDKRVGPEATERISIPEAVEESSLPPPDEIHCVRVEPTRIVVKWKPIHSTGLDISHYIVYYKSEADRVGKQPVEWSRHIAEQYSNSAELINLNSAATYAVRMSSVDQRGKEGSLSAIILVNPKDKQLFSNNRTVSEHSGRFKNEAKQSSRRPQNPDYFIVRNLKCSAETTDAVSLEWLPPIETRNLLEYQIHYTGRKEFLTNTGIPKTVHLGDGQQRQLPNRPANPITSDWLTASGFQSPQSGTQLLQFDLKQLEPNSLYEFTVRPMYRPREADGERKEGISVTVICRTEWATPGFLQAPELEAIHSAVPDTNSAGTLIELRVYRISEENGPIHEYFVIVDASEADVLNSKEDSVSSPLPAQYSLESLSKNARMVRSHEPYLAIATTPAKLFLVNQDSTIVMLGSDHHTKRAARTKLSDQPREAGDQNENRKRSAHSSSDILEIQDHENTNIIAMNKPIDPQLVYRVACRICSRYSDSRRLCSTSHWSKPIFPNDPHGKLALINEVPSPVGLSSWRSKNPSKFISIVISLALGLVFFAVLSIILGCILRQRKRQLTERHILGSAIQWDAKICEDISKSMIADELRGMHRSMVDEKLRGQKYTPCNDQSYSYMYHASSSGLHSPSESSTGIATFTGRMPIPLSQFVDFVCNAKRNGSSIFLDEFQALESNASKVCFSTTHSQLDTNKTKNRCSNAVPFDHNRVQLRVSQNAYKSDYINASYVDGFRKQNAYVATQAPLPETMQDFWSMIWDQKSAVIVSLSGLVEEGEIMCDRYWPLNGSEQHGQISVTNIETTELAYYTMRTFLIQKSGLKDSRKIWQLQYTNWPTQANPTQSTAFRMFQRRIGAVTPSEFGPIVVHCATGTGRTGLFIAIDMLLEQIKNEQFLDVFGLVNRLRSQRLMLVQTVDQYQFIYYTVMQALIDGNTEVFARNLGTHVAHLNSVQTISNALNDKLNSSSKTGRQLSQTQHTELGLTGFQLEFRKINSAVPVISNSSITSLPVSVSYENGWNLKLTNTQYTGQKAILPCGVAGSAVNQSKNRILSIVPFDWNRVPLCPIRGVDGSDYVNGSLVDGYCTKNAYIACQAPMAGTVEDFWRMVWEHKSDIIVMMCDLKEGGKEKCFKYWPSEKAARFQFFVVDPTREYKMSSYIVREFKITDARDGESRQVRQLHYVRWPEHGVPTDGGGLIDLIGYVHKLKEQSGCNSPITVHCSSGAGRTGVFIALCNVLERLRQESVVDMYQTVKLLRQQRVWLVQTEEQYRFCYLVTLEYLSSFDLCTQLPRTPPQSLAHLPSSPFVHSKVSSKKCSLVHATSKFGTNPTQYQQPQRQTQQHHQQQQVSQMKKRDWDTFAARLF